ncbi:MAG TPA: hypothetical protein VGL41_15370, partial [Roseiarcus sp.]
MFPSSRFPGEIPFAFYDFSRRYGQENFRSAFGADFAVSLRERERPDDSLLLVTTRPRCAGCIHYGWNAGADFSSASSDVKALGAFFCNFVLRLV